MYIRQTVNVKQGLEQENSESKQQNQISDKTRENLKVQHPYSGPHEESIISKELTAEAGSCAWLDTSTSTVSVPASPFWPIIHG